LYGADDVTALLKRVQQHPATLEGTATAGKHVSVDHNDKNARRVREFEAILALLYGDAMTLEYLVSINVPGNAVKQQLIGSVLVGVLSHAHKKSPTYSATVPKELRTALASLFGPSGRFFGHQSLSDNAYVRNFVVGARKTQVEAGFAQPRQADRFDIDQFLAVLCSAFKVIQSVRKYARARARAAYAAAPYVPAPCPRRSSTTASPHARRRPLSRGPWPFGRCTFAAARSRSSACSGTTCALSLTPTRRRATTSRSTSLRRKRTWSTRTSTA
jgi:hypothetical protein